MNTKMTLENKGVPPIAALAEKAWDHGRKKALKANDGFGYQNQWSEMPEASRIGFVAMTKFIAQKLKRHAKNL